MESTTAASGGEQRSPKRRRTPTKTFEAGPASHVLEEEERMLAIAIANSRKDQGRVPVSNIPFGPTFHPTVEEFSGDPLVYLEKIRPVAEKYGMFMFCTVNMNYVVVAMCECVWVPSTFFHVDNT